MNPARHLNLAVRIGFPLFLLATPALGQIAIQDGSPLGITHATVTAINKSFTVTGGAKAMIVILEERGARLSEPATLTWNGQLLNRAVQTAYNTGVQRSLAIYYLYNPNPGTATITGTMTGAATDTWLTAYTLTGVDTDTVPISGNVNTGADGTGVFSLAFNLTGVAAGSWAAVAAQYANFPDSVNVTGTGGTATVTTDNNFNSTSVTAGYVSGLSAGAVSLATTWVRAAGGQKSNFAALVFAPTTGVANTPQRFGIKFLGNTTEPVSTTAGVVPMSNWNNVANGSFSTGTIHSTDNSASATLTITGTGGDNTWKSGIYPDGGGNFSLLYGYQDAGKNAAATNVISGLTGSTYDVYLYTAGDSARPGSGTDYLPNYTINGTTYYAATLDGRSAMWKWVKGTTVSQNSNTYPSPLVAGHYIKINNIMPVGGAITISANSDNLTYRSPLNAIQLMQRGNAPQILTPPLAHRLYTGGTAQFQVEAQGTDTLTYRWRRNGVDLDDSTRISGSQTNSLNISTLVTGDTGDYDVVVSNGFGSTASETAHLDAVVMNQADAAFEAWIASYLVVNPTGETFIAESLTKRDFAFMWQQAFMIWMVEDTYDRTHSPDHKRLLNDLLNTFMKQNGTTLTWDNWDDDLEWGNIALIRGYQLTGNVVALNSAIYVWNAVMDRGLDDTFGGGIWEKLPKTNSKCALSNYPQIIAGMYLYQVTGDTSYVTKCESIYAWSRANLFISTPAQAISGMNLGQVNEGVAFLDDVALTGQKVLQSDNAYNSGLLVNAACALYEVTGNPQYLSDAVVAANHQVNKAAVMNENHVNNGYFGGEQMVRSVARLGSLDNNKLWPTYWPWLRANATAAWANRRTDLNLTKNKWAEPTAADATDLYAMETEAASLVQQVTPVTMPAFVDWTTKLTGTVIGTTGTFGGGNTRDKALDGNVATYFDAPAANGAWVGLDLGTAKNVSAIRYYPRNGEFDRMMGGVFQGANQANFSDAVTLYTVTVMPSQGVYHLMPAAATQSFRYVRYLSPNGGWGNVSEVEFYAPGKPPAPLNLQASRNATSAVIVWQPSPGAQSYNVKRSTTAAGSYQIVAANVSTASYTDPIADPGGRFFYVISGVSNTTGEGADSAAVEAIDGYIQWAIAKGLVPGSTASAFDSDGDGIQNGVEYAVPDGLKTAPAIGPNVQLTADVRADDLISVVLLKSPDLVSWTALPAMQVIEPSDAAAGFRRLSLIDAAGAEEKQNFYRLKVAR